MKKHLLAFLALFGLAASANIAKAESVDIVFSCSQSKGNVISASNAVTKTYMLAANSQDLVSSLSNASYLAGGTSKSVRVGTYSSSVYTKGSLTLNLATGYKIKSIDVKLATYKSSNNKAPKNPTWNLEINGNQMAADLSSEVKTATTYSIPFSDSSTEVKSLTIKNTNAPVEVYSLTINYAEDGPITVSTPTFSNVKGQVTLGCSTTGATIMYHVGEAAVTDASACTDEYKNTPFSVTKGQWVSAYAKKDGATASKVVSKQITWEIGNVTTTPAAVNEDITISEGTSIIFASENADKLAFKVDDEAEETVDNPYTYTPAKDVIVTVTPVDNGTKVEDKTAVFTITIKQAEVWSLVASLGDMPLDGQYIIVSNDGKKAMSNEVYGNYRKLTDVTVENGSLIEPSSSVLRFVVEKEGDSYLWKTLNYGGENGSNKEVYLNVAEGSDNNYLLANNPISSNQGRRNTTVSFNGENVNIDFTLSERSVRYNAGSTRFAAYLTSNKDMSKTENLVKLYRLGGTPMPKFTQNADGAVVFVSKAGELHIRLENRDKDGNPIVDVASSMLARAAEVEWTNKVAEESEEYVIPVPTEPVHTVYIEAKSVNNGIHSEVNKLTLNQEGTTTGIEGVEAENENAPVEYFNLQGVRVMNPGQGLYIRRQGNRVEKVALR